MSGWMVLGCIMMLAPFVIMIITVYLQAGWGVAVMLGVILLAALTGTLWVMLGISLATGQLP